MFCYLQKLELFVSSSRFNIEGAAYRHIEYDMHCVQEDWELMIVALELFLTMEGVVYLTVFKWCLISVLLIEAT